jgi:hypothetical protein
MVRRRSCSRATPGSARPHRRREQRDRNRLHARRVRRGVARPRRASRPPSKADRPRPCERQARRRDLRRRGSACGRRGRDRGSHDAGRRAGPDALGSRPLDGPHGTDAPGAPRAALRLQRSGHHDSARVDDHWARRLVFGGACPSRELLRAGVREQPRFSRRTRPRRPTRPRSDHGPRHSPGLPTAAAPRTETICSWSRSTTRASLGCCSRRRPSRRRASRPRERSGGPL